jgi:hypothetical protein
LPAPMLGAKNRVSVPLLDQRYARGHPRVKMVK